ncbi:MAG: serine protease [bacterium]|nr:serine protease [bacterium]
MTLFGKLLVLFLLALAGGVGTLVVKNFQPRNASPALVYSDVLENIRTIESATTSSEISETPTTTPTALPPVSKPETPISAIKLPLPIPPVVSVIEPDWNKINEQTRAALANILCVSKNGDIFKPLSGSGVFIDPRGVILTNAHVAQYMLLTGGGEASDLLDCTVRIGNPAENRYRADILFISPRWITDNAKNLLEESPKERGENDYALLVVTDTTNPDGQLPSSFPFISLREKLLDVGTKDAFLVAGYPAGFLGGIAVQRALYSASAFATIQSRYTLGESTLDMVGLGGNLLAQKGASGGAVVDGAGELAGLITTAIVEGATDARDVRALTTDYIARAFKEEAGFSLYEIKNADLASLSQQFNTQIAPALRKKLTDVIHKTGN